MLMFLRYIFALLICSFFSNALLSQNATISYKQLNNGKENPAFSLNLRIQDNVAHLSAPEAKTKSFIDYNRKETYTTIALEGKLYKKLTSFNDRPKAAFTGKKEMLLGYDCSHAKFTYFSNHIDVFYTEETTVSGGPYLNFLPSEKALVLKVVINGNRVIVADQIDIKDLDKRLEEPYERAQTVSDEVFEEYRIRSRYKRVNVFNDQQINFDPSIEKHRINKNTDKVYRFSKGTIVLKKVALPESVKNGGYTYVDFSCRSNGDAYDRTGSIFAIFSKEKQSMLDAMQDSIGVVPSITDNNGKEYQGYIKTANYDPPVELMRFFTTFGVDHFNEKRKINNYPWFEDAHYDHDVSDLIPTDVDSIWIGVFVGNYDKGGHIINLDLNFYPAFGQGSKTEKWIQPLFSTINIMEMSGQNYPRLFKNDTLKVDFEIPEGITALKLLYTTTGHGGWGGGDEFNPRQNKILIDGKEVFKIVPWRSDCATYRLYNPASGNFENGLSSSDFSRSNWCPGTLTPPFIVPLPDLETGNHTIEVIIDQGDDEGSSFNAWSVTGVLSGIKMKD